MQLCGLADWVGQDGAPTSRITTRFEEIQMSGRSDHTASRRQRFLAWGAIASAAVLTLTLLGFAYRNAFSVLGVLGGLAVAVAGAWWAITERPPRRWVGTVGIALGFVVVVVALIGASADTERPWLRFVASLALFATMATCARLAVVRDLHALDDARPRRVEPPRHPVLICNPWSGGGKVETFGLVDLAHELGVETIMLDHGLDLETLARDAVARGADCLGMAGGDGSQALVASIAVECGVPFVCVSAGTRNHFALDLGIDRVDPRKSVYAFRDAVERHIDYATVNGRFFVNNVSLGVYATIVQQDGYRDAKAVTARSLLPELLGNTTAPFDLQFTKPDGVEVDGAFLVQISNNPYALNSSLDAMQRRRIDTGTLGVIALTATTGKDAAAVVTLTAIGQRNRSKNWHEFTTETFEVRSRSGSVFAGVDGEALDLPTPLTCQIHPGGLRMLVPEGNLEAAELRRARDVSLRELLDIARS
jgi:diacylglycerol kinase family enzyme